jgi:hypothetical protein
MIHMRAKDDSHTIPSIRAGCAKRTQMIRATRVGEEKIIPSRFMRDIGIGFPYESSHAERPPKIDPEETFPSNKTLRATRYQPLC